MKMTRLIPMLPVKSLAASVEFYCGKLGFEVESRNDHWGWAMLRFDECRLMVDESIRGGSQAVSEEGRPGGRAGGEVGRPAPSADGGEVGRPAASAEGRPGGRGDGEVRRPSLSGHVIYLYPDDVAAYHALVRKNGLAVPELNVTFYGLTEFRICDPDGNRLWIGQNKATQG